MSVMKGCGCKTATHRDSLGPHGNHLLRVERSKCRDLMKVCRKADDPREDPECPGDGRLHLGGEPQGHTFAPCLRGLLAAPSNSEVKGPGAPSVSLPEAPSLRSALANLLAQKTHPNQTVWLAQRTGLGESTFSWPGFGVKVQCPLLFGGRTGPPEAPVDPG